ncbi:hypothetical protein ACWF0M_12725 [Kribbella sp. NPDC055110]
MGLEMAGGMPTPVLSALIALIGACLIHFMRSPPTPVLVAIGYDGNLVELPVADGP